MDKMSGSSRRYRCHSGQEAAADKLRLAQLSGFAAALCRFAITCRSRESSHFAGAALRVYHAMPCQSAVSEPPPRSPVQRIS